ncbi:MAG: GNAT family N-acetyltransferase [Chitinophagaceae bacterium]|nr:MAG: GNAT family N-acetyltransferase [Chitinophagaceae bacterium]
MEKIIIRQANSSDLEILLRFEQGVMHAERPFDPTLKQGPLHYYDIEELIHAPHIELVVAELNGQQVGCGYARIEKAKPYLQHSQYAYLGFMYTDPAHRGKGINKLIIESLKRWTLSQNITEMRLEVYYNNSAAIIAYEKAGFTKHMIEMRMPLKEE